MRIGLTMRVVKTTEYYEPRDAISHNWFDLLQSWNCTPVLIPNKVNKLTSYLQTLLLDGLILTGGNNLSPELAGHPEWKISDTAPLRDDMELQLLKHAEEQVMPVFGVCRGLQIINCFLGGTLITVDPVIHVAKNHGVKFQGDPWKNIYGSKARVNSYHNYGISSGSLAEKLDPCAFDDNGLVGAAAHQSLPIMGCMWHPEREQQNTGQIETVVKRLLTGKAFWRL